MTTRMYLSTDVGAPVLNGVAGSALAVLRGCLVTGYGSQVAAGWAEEFTGTNIAVFRSTVGNRHRFQVNDTFGLHCWVKGFLTMTDVNTGTGPFPNATDGRFLRKSSVADSSTRAWIVVADERTVHMVSQNDLNVEWVNGQLLSFGEFVKFNPLWPALNSYVMGSNLSGASADANTVATSPSTVAQGLSTSMSVDGSQSTISSRRRVGSNSGRTEGNYGGLMSNHTATATPSISSGGLLTSPIAIHSSTLSSGGENYTLLGHLRGFREFLHDRPLNNLDTINGAGDLATRAYVAVKCGQNNAQVLLETSDTWET